MGRRDPRKTPEAREPTPGGTGTTREAAESEAMEVMEDIEQAILSGDFEAVETLIDVQCRIEAWVAENLSYAEAGLRFIQGAQRAAGAVGTFLGNLIGRQTVDNQPVGCEEMRYAASVGWPENPHWKSDPWPVDDGAMTEPMRIARGTRKAPGKTQVEQTQDTTQQPQQSGVATALGLFTLVRLFMGK